MRNYQHYKIFDQKQEGGASGAVLVGDFRHVVVSLNTEENASFTVQAVGSMQEEAPNFEGAQGPDNAWDFIEMKDLQDGSSVDGDTGLVFSGADDNRQFEVNVNALRWFALVVTGYSAGNVSASVNLYED